MMILCSIVLFLCSATFLLYDKDIYNLKNKEYSSNCEYTLSNDIFTINAICIQKKQLPKLTLVDIVNRTWDQIEGFSGYYQPQSLSFNYYGATPKFKTKGNPYLQGDEKSDQLIADAIKHRKKIKVSYDELAQYYADHLSYFVADKDLVKLGRCTRTNYDLALKSMDNYVLNPGDVLNINKKLVSLKGYCIGKSEEQYLFYGGVCGMVSQLFRVSLLNPGITITKRFPHGEWFVQYYGEEVGGDDAAVYERSKIFEIQNSGKSDIIFKVSEEGNHSLLVAISRPTNQWVNISKENINGRSLAVHLDKTVYSTADSENLSNIERVESFDSFYSRKTYEYR